MTTLLPELATRGLILWRLRRSPDEQLWCSVCDLNGELTLTVHAPGMPRTSMSEVHTSVGSLVDRANKLHSQLESSGWHVVDVDLDEPD